MRRLGGLALRRTARENSLAGRLAGLLLAVLLAQSAMAAEIDDHPLISRYPGATPTRTATEEFQAFDLITGVVADSLDFESIPLEGRVTRINYDNPRGRSPLEILANYEQAITGAGGELLFTCADAACGPAHAGSRWGRFNGTINLPAVGGYVAGKISSGSEVAYIAIGVAKRRHQITIVELREMEAGLVEIDPQALGQELDRLGHVAIPGVFFETGKATLQPQSDAALAAMAQILGDRPGLKVWVVGHTDWTGAFGLNIDLSHARARSVADALVERHQIDAGRLQGHGVGPLAPVASNGSEAGRAANRRVELVVQP
jgi:outer membrane protein OmpA-like peptidoglycan-associated protein